MKEYDLFIPLSYNDGTAIEAQKLRNLQDLLLREFGGLTVFPQPNEGYWRMGEVTYRDEIIIYRVITAKVRSARHFMSRLKQELKKDLDQEEILIIERDVETI